MKSNNKFNIAWIAGLAALIILILLLTTCTGKRMEDVPADRLSETSPMSTTAVTEEAAQPAEETAVPTEETTEPTAETTEATEETTASDSSDSTAGGSSTPGGSDGYDPNTDDDEDEDEEEATLEVPDPGTQKNPYVEMLSEYPGTVKSVNIPAGKSFDYLIFGSAGTILTIENPEATVTLGETTYKADENGIVRVDLSEAAADPVIRFANAGAAETAFKVHVTEAPGGKTNPEVLTDITKVAVKLEAEDLNGYYYSWTPAVSGELVLTTESENLEILVTIGGETTKLSDAKDGKLVFKAAPDEEILIQVMAIPDEEGKYPAVEAEITGEWKPDSGTKENPYVQTLTEIPGTFDTVQIPAGSSAFYHIFNAGGTILTIEDPAVRLTYNDTVCELPAPEEPEETEATEGTEAAEETEATEATDAEQEQEESKVLTLELAPVEEGQPVVLELNNIGTEAAVYGLNFVYPLGASGNPEILESIDSIPVTLEAEDLDGYHYQWTAQTDGTVTMAADAATVNCEITLIDPVSDTEYIAENGIVSADVEMGQALLIRVMAVQEESGAYPAVQTTLTGAFQAAPGTSAENPLVISDPLTATAISFQAGETVYISGMFHEMIASVENTSGAAITYGEQTMKAARSGELTMMFPRAAEEEVSAILFALTSEREQACVLTFAYPVGHAQNPAELVLGENSAELEENDADGYLFNWTAECDGFLTVAMDENAGWQYTIENVTAGTGAETYTSGDDTLTASRTVEVKSGEQLRISVNTFDPESVSVTPAGTVTVIASFYDPLLGTEAKPIVLDAAENTVNTITVPAGKTLYYSAEAEGMVMTLNGKDVAVTHTAIEYPSEENRVTLVCQGSNCVFAVRNDAQTDQNFQITFTYPLGHRENPEELTLGENLAQIDADRKFGYAFAWKADCAGELTVTMEENAQWQFVIENLTEKTAGVIHTSAETPKSVSETVTVELGDEILVTVNTFDPENAEKPPVGTVKFTVSFVDPTLGMEENPIWLDITDEITVPAGKTMYCTAKADGMVMTLKGSNVTVIHNGVAYGPEKGIVQLLCEGASTFEPPVFAITNGAEEEAVYSVGFEYPLGHFMNPIPLQTGKNSTVLEEENSGGCYFQWTAEEDGILTITLDPEDQWQYVINNLTTGINGDIHCSTDVPVVPAQTVQVRAGDEIQIIVNLYDAQVTEDEASMEIMFTSEFEASQPESADTETMPEETAPEATAE